MVTGVATPRAAPRFVLVHGFTGAPESWDVVTAEWQNEVVLRPTVSGHGGHDAFPIPTTFDEEVTRLATYIRGRCPEPVTICGYSLGARLGLGLVVSYPELFAQAILIGVHPGLAEGDVAARQARVAQDERWAQQLEQDGLEAFVRAWEQLPLFETQRELPSAVLDNQRDIRLRHQPAALATALRALTLGYMPDYAAQLRATRVPTQLVVGERDAKFCALAAPFTDAVPSVQVEVVPNCGHNVVLEDPVWVRSRLTDALRSGTSLFGDDPASI